MFNAKSLIGTAVAVAVMATAPAAVAKDGDVLVNGACTGGVTSKLKLSHEDGRIEVEFEVDQNRVGQRWAWNLTDNGVRVGAGTARTAAPSGSFEVRRVIANRAGRDTVVATATQAGRRCTARASI